MAKPRQQQQLITEEEAQKLLQPQPQQEEIVITQEQFDTLFNEHTSKSAMIRALAAENYTTAQIARTLLHYGVLSPTSAYQHTRNVLTTPLKRTKTNNDG